MEKLKRSNLRHEYKVTYTSPLTAKKEKKWLPVDEVTRLNLGEEGRKQRLARVSNKRQKAHHSRYYIPMETNDYKKIIEDQRFVVAYNPGVSGNP